MACSGTRTGASGRNWGSYGEEVVLSTNIADWQRDLLTDPQTSGGLLVAVAPDGAEMVMACIRAAGFPQASIVGEMHRGTPRITVG